MSNHLLLVEDDAQLAGMVKDYLTDQGYQISIESNGLAAIDRIANESFDAIILDIGLPGSDGFSVCRAVRPKFDGPIIVLTARGDEVDEVIALEVGADDFMSKPIRPRALLARLKNHLRRGDAPRTANETSELVIDDLVINVGNRSVTVAGNEVELTTAEFELLEYLARNAGRVVPRKEIYIDLLELPYDGLDRSIDLRISRVRRKLGDDSNHPTRIKSVRGVGYLLAKST